LGGVCAFAST